MHLESLVRRRGAWLGVCRLLAPAILLAMPAQHALAGALKARLLPVTARDGQLRMQSDGRKTTYEYDSAGQHHLRLAVAVEDEKGRPVRGLSLAQMSAIVDGDYRALTSDEMQVTPAYFGEQGMSLTLVVDTSTSMYGAPLAECKKLSADLIDALTARDVLSIVRFSGAAHPLCEHINDKSVLHLFVDSFKPDMAADGSVLTDALQRAIEAMPDRAELKAVLLLSDGENAGSLAAPAAVVDEANAADCPIFMVGYGQREVKEALLEQLASGSAGARFPTSASAADILRKVRPHLMPHYLVTIKTDKLPADGQSHRIALRVELETDSGATGAAVLVTGVEKAEMLATGALVLIPVLLVLVSGVALFLLTRLHSRRQESHAGQPVSSAEGPAPAQIKLCPVCRRAMPPGESSCPVCGYEESKIISMDDVED